MLPSSTGLSLPAAGSVGKRHPAVVQTAECSRAQGGACRVQQSQECIAPPLGNVQPSLEIGDMQSSGWNWKPFLPRNLVYTG